MSGMRQIVVPRHPSGSGFAHETGGGRSWTEPLFQVRLTPRDLTKRFGFRFQESREDGLGTILITPAVLPSGRQLTWWCLGLLADHAEGRYRAHVTEEDFVEADLTEEVIGVLGGDPSVIIWRAPTACQWPSPLGV